MKVINTPSLILQQLNERGCFIVALPNSKGFITIPVERVVLIYKNNIAFFNHDCLLPYEYVYGTGTCNSALSIAVVSVINVEYATFGNVFTRPGTNCSMNYEESKFFYDTAVKEMANTLQQVEYNRMLTLSTSTDAIPERLYKTYFESLSNEEKQAIEEYKKSGGTSLCTTNRPINFLEVVERVNPTSLSNQDKQFLKEKEGN